MKNLIFCITLTVSTLASSPVSLANDPAAANEAMNYFDANWAVFNIEDQRIREAIDNIKHSHNA